MSRIVWASDFDNYIYSQIELRATCSTRY